jgi:hypothetical protein
MIFRLLLTILSVGDEGHLTVYKDRARVPFVAEPNLLSIFCVGEGGDARGKSCIGSVLKVQPTVKP